MIQCKRCGRTFHGNLNPDEALKDYNSHLCFGLNRPKQLELFPDDQEGVKAAETIATLVDSAKTIVGIVDRMIDMRSDEIVGEGSDSEVLGYCDLQERIAGVWNELIDISKELRKVADDPFADEEVDQRCVEDDGVLCHGCGDCEDEAWDKKFGK